MGLRGLCVLSMSLLCCQSKGLTILLRFQMGDNFDFRSVKSANVSSEFGSSRVAEGSLNEGHTVPGTAGTPELFAVKCEDVLHAMSQCRRVECGGAPGSACATTEHVSGHVFTYDQKVTFSHQTDHQVGLNRSKKTFQTRVVFKSRLRGNGSFLIERLPDPRGVVPQLEAPP